MNEQKINNVVYSINRKLDTKLSFTPQQHQSRFTYYDASNKITGEWVFLANYGQYWGVGKSFYDSATALEAAMFAANREKFMKIIDSERNANVK